jgi:CIC family chloride channel protein
MGTLFAGIIRAPMTSVIMIFELTQDYKILAPLMIANMLSLAISRRFQPKPVYVALLEQNHIYLPESDARADQTSWKAVDIMTPHVDVLTEDTSFEEAWRQLQEKQQSTFLVSASDRLRGSIHRKTIEHAIQSGNGAKLVGSSVNVAVAYVHPDHPLELALERFDPALGILPVVSRRDGRRLEGVITIDTILRFIHRTPTYDSKIPN